MLRHTSRRTDGLPEEGVLALACSALAGCDAGGVLVEAAVAATGAAVLGASSASAARDHALKTRATGMPGVKRFIWATRLSDLIGVIQATRKLNERQPA